MMIDWDKVKEARKGYVKAKREFDELNDLYTKTNAQRQLKHQEMIKTMAILNEALLPEFNKTEVGKPEGSETMIKIANKLFGPTDGPKDDPTDG